MARWVCVVGVLILSLNHATRADTPPHVWIFSGHPGDMEHHAALQQRTERLVGLLHERYGVPRERCRVLRADACRAEHLAAAFASAARLRAAGEPVWMFFFGHANPTERGANYNLLGPDLSNRQLGRAMAGIQGAAPLVVIFTTACSGAFLAELAGPGRVLVSATLAQREVNETFFPDALLDALDDSATDQDGDGRVSVLEIYNSTIPRVVEAFATENLLQTEHALLDGNGDGRGTALPAEPEIEGASGVFLKWREPLGDDTNAR